MTSGADGTEGGITDPTIDAPVGATAEAVARALADDLTIDITTTGRRSGQPQRIEIWFLNIDGRIFITGTPGPRDWLANLAADNRLIFHLKESTEADLDATAELVTDETSRRRIFEHHKAHWYRTQTSLDDLVKNAPMVEIFFDG
ncbi:MAG: nitroreductase/quinone reductase family protein [Acidimicrobiia bacterium]|nr:nitroreductase/quinone reductase family protein [Acidimicrobiia bacterium]